MSSPQHDLKALRQKISQLTNKTITSIVNLGYDQYLTIDMLTNYSQPIEVLEQVLDSLLRVIPYTDGIFDDPQRDGNKGKQVVNVNQISNGQTGRVQRELTLQTQQPQQREQPKFPQDSQIEPLELKSQLQQSEQHILQSLQHFVQISQALSDLSLTIYDRSYPIDLYKKFRKLYEEINSTSNILHHYQPQFFVTEGFLERKEELINEQILFLERVVMAKGREQSDNGDQSERSGYGLDVRYSQKTTNDRLPQKPSRSQYLDLQHSAQHSLDLQSQITRLQSLLTRNNHEYSISIRKYNDLLTNLQQEIEHYQSELQKQRIIERQMKSQIERMGEERYKDQIVIQNMAKKIRGLERIDGSRLKLRTIEDSAVWAKDHRVSQTPRASYRQKNGYLGLKESNSATGLGIARELYDMKKKSPRIELQQHKLSRRK